MAEVSALCPFFLLLLLLLLLRACRAQSIRPRFSRFRDAIPACNNDEFLKEASEVPNFLEEVDQCRRVYSAASSGEFSSARWNNVSASVRDASQVLLVCFLEQKKKGVSPRWCFWELDQLCR